MNKNNFEKIVKKFLIKEKKWVKDSTFSTYLSLINSHIIPYFKEINIEDIDSNKIQKFILKMSKKRNNKNKKLSVKTIKDTVGVLKQIINFAYEVNIIEKKDFSYKLPTNNEVKSVKVFSILEQQKLLEYCQKNKDKKNIGIMLSLTLGLRIGEVCGIKWEDIDLDNETLNVKRTVQRIYINYNGEKRSKIIVNSPKTKKSLRVLPLNRELIDYLICYKNKRNTYILTNSKKSIEPKNYRIYYYKILEQLKIKKLSFHSLRHSFASNAIELGSDYKTVSEILGHTSINTTLNLYVHPRIEQKKECISSVYKYLYLK